MLLNMLDFDIGLNFLVITKKDCLVFKLESKAEAVASFDKLTKPSNDIKGPRETKLTEKAKDQGNSRYDV